MTLPLAKVNYITLIKTCTTTERLREALVKSGIMQKPTVLCQKEIGFINWAA